MWRVAPATRWASVKSRLERPRSSGWDRPPSTAGTSPGLAGEAACLGGGDEVAGVEAGGPELAAEGVEVEGDHDGGGDLAVEPVGGQVLEEVGEGEAAVVGPVAVRARLPALAARGAEPAATRRGHRVEGLAQDRRRQGRHREVAAGRAVAVVVEREPGPCQRGDLLVPQLGVLVGVEDRGVVLDRRQRAARESPQLDRVDPPGLARPASPPRWRSAPR